MPRGCVISAKPLVVLSSINHDAPLGVLSQLPDYFRGRRSLHFLSPSWSLDGNFQMLHRQVQHAKVEFPEAEFVILANEESELIELQLCGLRSVLGNASIFIDESIFVPKFDVPKHFDAVYNAVLKPFKNHMLCREISSLALIYYLHGDETLADLGYANEVRNFLAHATFLNDERVGPNAILPLGQVCDELNRFHVGLCLSAREGTMRACVEYLLCGMPVVSIPATGGRMRYLNENNSRLVFADAKSVALAVQDLKRIHFDPQAIRHNTLTILQFERDCFVESVNLLAFKFLGVPHLLLDFSAFKTAINYKSVEHWKEALDE